MSHCCDYLPQSSGVSALVRRIVFKLNAELLFNGHRALTDAERASMFNLGDASVVLDGVAVLKRMAMGEQRARRDLLELFETFAPKLLDVPAMNAGGM